MQQSWRHVAFSAENDAPADVIFDGWHAPGACFADCANCARPFICSRLSRGPAINGLDDGFSPVPLADYLTLISRMLFAHKAGVEPHGFAKQQWIHAVVDAVAHEEISRGGKDPLCVKAVAVGLALGRGHDFVCEHRAEHVDVDRDGEIPPVYEPGVHEEVDEHAHHFLLEPIEAPLAFVLDPLARFLVGGDVGKDVSWIAVPVSLDRRGVFDPSAGVSFGHISESERTKEGGEFGRHNVRR